MTETQNYIAKVPGSDGSIEYTTAEYAIWRDLFAAQMPKVERYMARPYLDGLARIGLEGDRVPCCRALSERLEGLCGWRIEPVPALIDQPRFFAMLAARRFPAASFIRRREDFDYIEEPDIFHEIFGHVPLLTDPGFARFSEAIGRAGLQARAEDHPWLTRLYWFSIEFGLTVEAGRTKALGAGLASSPGELVRAIESDAPERVPFDIMTILRTPYRIDVPQERYFVIPDPEVLFDAAERDLLADVAAARALGPLKGPDMAA